MDFLCVTQCYREGKSYFLSKSVFLLILSIPAYVTSAGKQRASMFAANILQYLRYKVFFVFLFCFLSAPTTQDQTPSSGVSVATPSVSVSTSAPSATPVQTVPQPVPQTLPPAVPHAVPQPTAAIPAFPPVMVPPFRVPLPGMPIPLPGKLANCDCLVRYMSMLSICLHSCVHCVWNLPESSPLRAFLKEFRDSRQTF